MRKWLKQLWYGKDNPYSKITLSIMIRRENGAMVPVFQGSLYSLMLTLKYQNQNHMVLLNQSDIWIQVDKNVYL